jgi:hypothetical protein
VKPDQRAISNLVLVCRPGPHGRKLGAVRRSLRVPCTRFRERIRAELPRMLRRSVIPILRRILRASTLLLLDDGADPFRVLSWRDDAGERSTNERPYAGSMR